MKKTKLGEFEEFLLLAVSLLKDRAYGAAIKKELEGNLKERFSIGSVQSALGKLEEKGFLVFELSEVTPKRGGRRKKIYSITPNGNRVLNELADIRRQFWLAILESN